MQTGTAEEVEVEEAEGATEAHWVDEARKGEPADPWDQVVIWGCAGDSKEVHATWQHKRNISTWLSNRGSAPRIYLDQTDHESTSKTLHNSAQ